VQLVRNRLRAALVAVLAGSLLVATRKRRRPAGEVVKERADQARGAARRARKAAGR
jgi:hypothetical protein